MSRSLVRAWRAALERTPHLDGHREHAGHDDGDFGRRRFHGRRAGFLAGARGTLVRLSVDRARTEFETGIEIQTVAGCTSDEIRDAIDRICSSRAPSRPSARLRNSCALMGTSAEPVPRRIEQEAVSEAGERSSIIKADKKAGKLVGPYLVGELIGEGTQGKVKEAVHSETLRRVAIKIVNKLQLRKIKNAEENMKRELKIHRRLKHEHVVTSCSRCSKCASPTRRSSTSCSN